jgi:hypothetical protein
MQTPSGLQQPLGHVCESHWFVTISGTFVTSATDSPTASGKKVRSAVASTETSGDPPSGRLLVPPLPPHPTTPAATSAVQLPDKSLTGSSRRRTPPLAPRSPGTGCHLLRKRRSGLPWRIRPATCSNRCSWWGCTTQPARTFRHCRARSRTRCRPGTRRTASPCLRSAPGSARRGTRSLRSTRHNSRRCKTAPRCTSLRRRAGGRTCQFPLRGRIARTSGREGRTRRRGSQSHIRASSGSNHRSWKDRSSSANARRCHRTAHRAHTRRTPHPRTRTPRC